MKLSTNNYDVIVLGAGASGLMCAMTAARRGRRVLVLEKSNKVGKKILMSGGGRCNFTNQFVEADNFISNNSHFCKGALNRYTQWDFIAWVDQCHIETEERKHGQLFCVHSAKEILNMLLDECQNVDVEIRTKIDIKKIEHCKIDSQADIEIDHRYTVAIDGQQNLSCQSLVVATGALSIPTLGGSGMGYEIAKNFSLALVDRRAGLVPFMFSDDNKQLCEKLSGLALEASVSCRQITFHENILFTHRGLSGPAILQISNYWQPGEAICINLLPNLDAGQWLLTEKRKSGKLYLKNILITKLAKPLVVQLGLIGLLEDIDKRLADFTDQQLLAVAHKLQAWNLRPSATEGYRTAEVTLGGVDTNELSSKTMEAKKQPGLFFIGEVVDVTGHLGGFNFQWAWSSGYSAGLYV